MKKTKLFSTLTIYYMIMGSICFCALLGGVFVHFSNPENFFNGNPDAFSAYCAIFGGGSIMFLGITAYTIYANHKWRKGESLRDTGIRREMVVVDLEVDHTSNGKSFGWVVCQEPDESGNPKHYKSMQMAYNYCVKHCPIGSFILVYVDPKNPEHYFVDVDSAHIDKEQFQEMCEGTEIEQTIENNTVITFEDYHPENKKSTAGWVFVGIGLFIFYIVIFGKGNSISAYLFFSGMGIFFLTIGIYILYANARLRRLSKLVGTGMKFEASLHELVRISKEKNGIKHQGYRIWFTAQNPITGAEESFSFDSYDPRIREERVESGVVDVYVNPVRAKDTFMDASSCVLKLKG